MGGGGGGGGCQVAGYWYAAGAHLVFCTGIDELMSIVVQEKTIWYKGEVVHQRYWGPSTYCYRWGGPFIGSMAGVPYEPPCEGGANEVTTWGFIDRYVTQPAVVNNTNIYINKKNVFGGEDREGGIQGTVTCEFGGPTQGINGYLATHAGLQSANRGVFGLVLNQVTLACNSPQIKEWAIRARRTDIGWEPALAQIGEDMNPVHIIYDCLVTADWGGCQMPPALIGDTFAAVAQTLYDEGFGLSFVWTRNNSVNSFMENVLTHIDGVLYQDYETGKFEIKLARDDYGELDELPVIDPSNAVSLESYDVKSTTELINTITVKYTDPVTGKDQSLTMSDISAVQRLGGEIVTMEKEYFGVSKGSLANRIAMRDLRAAILPLATAIILVNRTQFKLHPGSVFVFNWPPLGFENVVMRVASVDIGSTDDSKIRVTATMDVFAFGGAIVAEPPDSGGWTDPIQDPADITEFIATEPTYWQALTSYGSDFGVVDLDTDSFLQIIARKPAFTSLNYKLMTKHPDSDFYAFSGRGDYGSELMVSGDVSQETSSVLTLVTPINEIELSVGSIKLGDMAYLGDELVVLAGINETRDEIQVLRGMVDTTPQQHTAPVNLLFFNKLFSAVYKEPYTEGEPLDFWLQDKTMVGELLQSNATEHSYTFTGRPSRPYPPGNVTVTGRRYPAKAPVTVDSLLEWAHRDRTQQLSHPPDTQEAEDIGPENGVSYQYTVTDTADSSVLLSGTTTDTALDLSALAPLSTVVRIELTALRSANESHQSQVVETKLVGYGKNYGEDYGGVE